MSLTDRKITDAQISANGVVSQPDVLTGTAAQNKAVFDKLISDVVKAALNNVIDDLVASTGAGEIGAAVTGLTGDDVQSLLEALHTAIGALDGNVVKLTVQSLTENQKEVVRSNIGVSGTAVAVNSVNGLTGNVWLQIPTVYASTVNGMSGTVVLWKDVEGTLSAGATSITLSDSSITEDSKLEYFTETFGVNPEGVSVSTGSVTLTFEAQESDMGVIVRVS